MLISAQALIRYTDVFVKMMYVLEAMCSSVQQLWQTSARSTNTAKTKIALKKAWNVNHLHWMEDHTGMITMNKNKMSNHKRNLAHNLSTSANIA